jgi:hypothetical protein
MAPVQIDQVPILMRSAVALAIGLLIGGASWMIAPRLA